eukprot:Selendium_serpulae@DN6319_c0_g1_i1.p2
MFVKNQGIFCNPISEKAPPKLRLLYECAPLALLLELAGGKASDGARPVLDIVSRRDGCRPRAVDAPHCVHLSVRLPMCLSVCPCVCRSACVFVCLAARDVDGPTDCLDRRDRRRSGPLPHFAQGVDVYFMEPLRLKFCSI